MMTSSEMATEFRHCADEVNRRAAFCSRVPVVYLRARTPRKVTRSTPNTRSRSERVILRRLALMSVLLAVLAVLAWAGVRP